MLTTLLHSYGKDWSKRMKLSKGFEQAIYVILILEIKGQGQPVKSATLSQELQVSDSSLKKVLRKLVLADLIKSVASKDGGFMLARPIEQISLRDVLLAEEGAQPIQFNNHHLAKQIFDYPSERDHIAYSERLIDQALTGAMNAYEESLSWFTLERLLKKNQ